MNTTRVIEKQRETEEQKIRIAFSQHNKRREDDLSKIGRWIKEGEIKQKLISEDSAILYELPPNPSYSYSYYRHPQRATREVNLTKIYSSILLYCETYKSCWVRPLSKWKSSSKNSLKEIKSLISHLFVKYDYPKCLTNEIFSDEIVFESKRDKIMDWFVFIAGGGNIRKIEKLPFTITKKAAHYFHNSPDQLSVSEAIRWGQIMSLGGNSTIATNIARSSFGRIFTHDALSGDNNNHFWTLVFTFLINEPSITKDWYDRIFDYLVHLRNTQPNVSMNGRTPESLIKQVLEFEKSSFKDKSPAKSWTGMEIPVFEIFTEEKTPNKNGEKTEHRYVIKEILSSTDLKKESSAMKHCVWSYADRCIKGQTSIFSLEKDGKKNITIEVDRASRKIHQKAGRFNCPPTYNDNMVIGKWAFENKLRN